MLTRNVFIWCIIVSASAEMGLDWSRAAARVGRPVLPISSAAPEDVFDLLHEKGHEHRFSVSRKHYFGVDLKRSQVLRATLQQRGVDVRVELLDPAGKLLLMIDSPNGDRGPEPVFLVAKKAGRYWVVVTCPSRLPAGGGYVFETVERRSKRPGDEALSRAVGTYYCGRELLQKGDIPAATSVLRNAARSLAAAGDREHAADAWLDLGQLLLGRMEWVESSEAFRQAERFLKRQRRPLPRSVATAQRARAEEMQGHAKTARYLLQQSLRLARLAGDEKNLATILLNLGNFHLARGEAPEAEGYLLETIGLFHELRDVDGEARALVRVGALYKRFGEIEKALERYESALRLAGLSPAVRGEVLAQIGSAYVAAGRADRAFQVYQQALDIERAQGDQESQAVILNGFGLAYVASKRFRDALDPYQRALAIYQSLRDNQGQAVMRVNLGWVLAQLMRYDEAATSFDQALRIARELQNPIWEAAARLGFAWMEHRRGELAEAQKQAEIAQELVEKVRSEIDDPKLRISFFSGKQDISDLLIAVLMERAEIQDRGQLTAEALHVSEGARARSLLDTLGGRRTLRVLSSAEISSQLDAGSVLLEYYLAEPRSYLWLVTPTSVEAFPLPGRKEIEKRASDVWNGMAERQPQAQSVQNARELSQLLLGQVAGRVAGKRLVIVASGALQTLPFGALPDPTVPSQGFNPRHPWPQPLITTHEIVFEPSASALAEIRARRAGRPRATRRLAVIADPVFERNDERVPRSLAVRRGGSSAILGYLERLRASRTEADFITARLPAQQVLKALGFAANRELFLSSILEEFEVIHIATHTFQPPGHPEQSALVLSRLDERGRPRDGMVHINDILRLKLRAGLVVLSACSSGVGRNVLGEGMVGLPQAFLSAGASGTLTSVWDVADETTPQLMRRVYENLALQQPPSLALRNAQLEIWRSAEGNPPWFWAGFVAQGEWRPDALVSLNKVSRGVSPPAGTPRDRPRIKKAPPPTPPR